MPGTPTLAWQASLFGTVPADVDRDFSTLVRRELDPRSWADHTPGWLAGSDDLFADLVACVEWQQRTRYMYDGKVAEPRLTGRWTEADGASPFPAVVEEMRLALCERYGRRFDSVGLNLYRDGRDSVAWHGDRIARIIEDPIVALVSLGSPRRFLLRPAPRGRSTRFDLGHGDLLVMGGACQREWQHNVPKVARAGPRISVSFRHSR